jgi:hypothetical protein
MPVSDILPVNFTISSAAREAIEQIRREYDAQFPEDTAAVLSVGWGIYTAESGNQFENVVIAYYPRSMLPVVAAGIQRVSGVDLVFFTIHEHWKKFAGKILDHAGGRGFFLRE